MKDTEGYIVEYTKKDGSKQQAYMRHKEQTKNYSDYQRAFLRLINKEGDFMTNEEGKKVIAVKHLSELTRIGFVD